MNYAVIFTYSFDGDVAVYLFATEEEAKKFLRDSYQEELRIDQEENGWSSVGEISEDGWYAKIQVEFDDADHPLNLTEFRIGTVHR